MLDCRHFSQDITQKKITFSLYPSNDKRKNRFSTHTTIAINNSMRTVYWQIPKSVESVVGAVDREHRRAGVRLGDSSVPLEDDDLRPDLVVDLVPLVQHFLYVVLGTKSKGYGKFVTTCTLYIIHFPMVHAACNGCVYTRVIQKQSATR